LFFYFWPNYELSRVFFFLLIELSNILYKSSGNLNQLCYSKIFEILLDSRFRYFPLNLCKLFCNFSYWLLIGNLKNFLRMTILIHMAWVSKLTLHNLLILQKNDVQEQGDPEELGEPCDDELSAQGKVNNCWRKGQNKFLKVPDVSLKNIRESFCFNPK